MAGPETANNATTGSAMIPLLVLGIPSIPATLGNFLVPLMIGAKDLAMPKLNLASWYVYNIGAAFTLWAIANGGVDTGWTFYTPFSTNYSNTYVISTALGVFITGFSSIFTGLNFIVTIHRMRAPGLTWFRLPLFIWSHYATSLIMVLGTPVLAITILLVAAERVLNFGSGTEKWIGTLALTGEHPHTVLRVHGRDGRSPESRKDDWIKRDLDEAATLDGLGHLAIIRRIILPVIAPGAAVTAIFTFVFAWNEYLMALILTAGLLTQRNPVSAAD